MSTDLLSADVAPEVSAAAAAPVVLPAAATIAPQPPSPKRQKLETALRELFICYDQWATDDGSGDRIPPQFWKQATALVRMAAQPPYADDAMDILCCAIEPWAGSLANVLAIKQFGMDGYEGNAAMGHFNADLERLRVAYDEMISSRQLPVLESLHDLVKLQNLTHEQAAKIYGWVDKDGYGLGWKVDQELAKPGTWLNDTWIDPRTKSLEEDLAALAEKWTDLGRLSASASKAAALVSTSILVRGESR